MKKIFILPLALISAVIFCLAGCESDKKVEAEKAAAPPAPQVEISTVKAVSYTPVIELPGRISPVKVAQVRARVAGILLSRDFTEGSDVQKGQILFHIDPAQYEASLAEARAELAKSDASMHDKGLISKRYSRLVKTKSVSQNDYDTALANFKVAKAVKQAAAAKVKTAALNLGYATVRAPISGRIGRAQVTEGALVGQGEATHMATIQQLDPIYADINEPVVDYLKLKAAMKGQEKENESAVVTVEVEEVGYKQEGRLLFSDVTVDQKTGQVALRSRFDNSEGMLLPGMFVRIKINMPTDNNAIFIPQRAIKHGQDGSAQVFVVDSANIVQPRVIQTGEMKGSRWQVMSGLKAGERIVVNGIDKVSPGMSLAGVEEATQVAQK